MARGLILSAMLAAALPVWADAPESVPQAPPVGGGEVGEALSHFPVGARDVLAVQVFDEPELSQELVVGQDGRVRFPLLGAVTVGGLTPPEIEQVLEQALRERFLVNPQVFVRLKEYNSRQALMLGLVKNPGAYPLPGGTTILDLISKAGGLSDHNVKSLVLIRGGNLAGDVGEAPVVIDAHQLLRQGDRDLNVSVRHGDILYAPQADGVYVYGEVRRPGVVAFRDGLSVLQAVSLAEGLTNRASPRRVHVIRTEDGMQRKIEVNLNRVARDAAEDVVLQPEDIVVVPQSLF
jgi:polysaccharide biosynthesis/export protein